MLLFYLCIAQKLRRWESRLWRWEFAIILLIMTE